MTLEQLRKCTAILALLCAALMGALARDVLVSRAAAADGDAVRRSDIERVVHALEAQATATKDVARAVERCK